jgi:hypothetical protein
MKNPIKQIARKIAPYLTAGALALSSIGEARAQTTQPAELEQTAEQVNQAVSFEKYNELREELEHQKNTTYVFESMALINSALALGAWTYVMASRKDRGNK